ncbi:GtrA family protein [Corynebacterium caspium]|uniref:GtrA family protein n=1 Tax=Corynebacterium caspium TaxID=234828 RepID=UPI000365E854|nr:GtrA family protein [Corynebacterium caspium]WKD58515.1 GtrA-like protein [Corynebacterium caspium DSM 44850]
MHTKTQALRFLISGALSAIPDLGLTWIFNFLLGVNVPISRTIGFIVGTTTAYMINRRWTFQAEASAKRFGQVVVLYAMTYIINIGGQTLIQHLLESWEWNKSLSLFIAFVISQGTATVINFAVQKLFIFK